MTISKDALLCVNQQKGKSVGKQGTTHRSSAVDIREGVIMAIQRKAIVKKRVTGSAARERIFGSQHPRHY